MAGGTGWPESATTFTVAVPWAEPAALVTAQARVRGPTSPEVKVMTVVPAPAVMVPLVTVQA